MAINHIPWGFVFGILGNIVSFMGSLAPLPTFYEIYKRKSAEGYQSIPYVVSLFSAMLWIYYALLNTDATLLITINSFCCLLQTCYIIFYFYYAPKKEKIETGKLVLVLDVLGFGVVCLSTIFLREALRVQVLGYICMAFALSVFAAPLCILRKVIRTKSVEYMPFTLSFFLTLGAIMWFFYGLLMKDLNIAIPNVVGFVFGILQMVLYAIYKNHPKKIVVVEDPQPQEMADQTVVDVVKLTKKQLPAADHIFNMEPAAAITVHP